jgi:transcriptional regulator with XRE-family HTH domain
VNKAQEVIDRKAFANDLRWSRENLGLTQAQLASCLGYDAATIYRWEACMAHVRGERCKRLALAMLAEMRGNANVAHHILSGLDANCLVR